VVTPKSGEGGSKSRSAHMHQGGRFLDICDSYHGNGEIEADHSPKAYKYISFSSSVSALKTTCRDPEFARTASFADEAQLSADEAAASY
jgi:hypothetical protein